MTRWWIFDIWFSITVLFVLIAISTFVFAKDGWKRLGMRVMLAVVWPFAMLSRAGRNLLFKVGEKL